MHAKSRSGYAIIPRSMGMLWTMLLSKRNDRIVRNHLRIVGSTFARHSPPLLTEFAAIASTRDQFVKI